MDNRRLVTILIVIAIAVPLVIEGMTLLGLVSQYTGDGGTGTPTPADTVDADDTVGVGDDLLPETDRSERLTTARVTSGNTWTLTITVQVSNTGSVPYELRLGAVVTGDGRRIDGSATTGEIPPNATTTVTHQWTLPSGSLPDRLAVTAVEHDGGATTLVDREVDLAHIPAEG